MEDCAPFNLLEVSIEEEGGPFNGTHDFGAVAITPLASAWNIWNAHFDDLKLFAK